MLSHLRPWVALLLLASCADLRERAVSEECSACHGAGEDGRPPPDLLGNIDKTARGVGAHEAHLSSPTFERPLDCQDCHVVPETVSADGHLDTDADDTLPDGSRTPADVILEGYDAEEVRCADTYCHARPGARHPAPKWTQADGSQIQCGSCHGAPPPDPHPAVERCSLCHPGVNETGDGFDDLALHLNGEPDLLPAQDCQSCHGRMADGAPPPDLDGNAVTTVVGVGAHLAHVDSVLSVTVDEAQCESCHQTPTEVTSAGHIDSGAPAEVRFDLGLGVHDGATPAWDRGVARCSDTYCHARPGAEHPEPKWILVDGTQTDCQGCHGTPPPPPHPGEVDCALCHGELGAATHVDGVVTFPTGCNACHGGATSDAPPPDLDGNTSTTSRGVGAHQTHLSGGVRGAQVGCGECHILPASVTAPEHIDSGRPAEVFFPIGGLARTGGSTPAWDAGTLTCSGVYCHQTEGGATRGGTRIVPVWNAADGTYNACGSCHGIPPPPPHFNSIDCQNCHPIASGPATLDPQYSCRHIDGDPFSAAVACP